MHEFHVFVLQSPCDCLAAHSSACCETCSARRISTSDLLQYSHPTSATCTASCLRTESLAANPVVPPSHTRVLSLHLSTWPRRFVSNNAPHGLESSGQLTAVYFIQIYRLFICLLFAYHASLTRRSDPPLKPLPPETAPPAPPSCT